MRVINIIILIKIYKFLIYTNFFSNCSSIETINEKFFRNPNELYLVILKNIFCLYRNNSNVDTNAFPLSNNTIILNTNNYLNNNNYKIIPRNLNNYNIQIETSQNVFSDFLVFYGSYNDLLSTKIKFYENKIDLNYYGSPSLNICSNNVNNPYSTLFYRKTFKRNLLANNNNTAIVPNCSNNYIYNENNNNSTTNNGTCSLALSENNNNCSNSVFRVDYYFTYNNNFEISSININFFWSNEIPKNNINQNIKLNIFTLSSETGNNIIWNNGNPGYTYDSYLRIGTSQTKTINSTEYSFVREEYPITSITIKNTDNSCLIRNNSDNNIIYNQNSEILKFGENFSTSCNISLNNLVNRNNSTTIRILELNKFNAFGIHGNSNINYIRDWLVITSDIEITDSYEDRRSSGTVNYELIYYAYTIYYKKFGAKNNNKFQIISVVRNRIKRNIRASLNDNINIPFNIFYEELNENLSYFINITQKVAKLSPNIFSPLITFSNIGIINILIIMYLIVFN